MLMVYVSLGTYTLPWAGLWPHLIAHHLAHTTWHTPVSALGVSVQLCNTNLTFKSAVLTQPLGKE